VIRVIAYGTVKSVTRKIVGTDRHLANFIVDCSGTSLRCVAWGDLAESVPDEGARVILAGRMATRSYVTQDNQERTITEVVIQDIDILDGEREVVPDEEPF
jgi:single-stranded DNA-binding protein